MKRLIFQSYHIKPIHFLSLPSVSFVLLHIIFIFVLHFAAFSNSFASLISFSSSLKYVFSFSSSFELTWLLLKRMTALLEGWDLQVLRLIRLGWCAPIYLSRFDISEAGLRSKATVLEVDDKATENQPSNCLWFCEHVLIAARCFPPLALESGGIVQTFYLRGRLKQTLFNPGRISLEKRRLTISIKFVKWRGFYSRHTDDRRRMRRD